MPTVDVSDILRDPDVGGQRFTVVRRVQNMTDFGRAEVTETRFENVVGAITPTGANSLVREEAFQTQQNAIRVVTPFMLRGPATAKDRGAEVEYMPDIIEWDGSHYVVKMLNDYASFGGGMVDAECLSIDYVDPAPKNRKILQQP